MLVIKVGHKNLWIIEGPPKRGKWNEEWNRVNLYQQRGPEMLWIMKGARNCCKSWKGPGNVLDHERGPEMLWIVKGARKCCESWKGRKCSESWKGPGNVLDHEMGPEMARIMKGPGNILDHERGPKKSMSHKNAQKVCWSSERGPKTCESYKGPPKRWTWNEVMSESVSVGLRNREYLYQYKNFLYKKMKGLRSYF